MKTISYIYIVIVALLIAAAACSEDFLNEPPRRDTIDDIISNPEEGAERTIAAVYNKLYDWGLHSFSWIGVTSIASDDADKGSDPGDTGADKHELDDWTFTPSSLSFNDIWISNFEGIGRATYAIRFVNQMDLPEAEKQRYIGEAKMLRAYFYWNLVRCFGGVPLITDVLESSEDIDAATQRASQEEIYAAIEQDLIDAAMVLPSDIPPSEYGRVSSYAAKGLLGKVYLYQQKWGESKQMCDDIKNGGFALMSDYAMIWREAGEFSEESIWEVNCIGTTPNLGINNYFVVQAPRGAGGLGWGFNTPTQDLVDAYEPGDVRKDATIITSGQTLWDGHVTNAAAPNLYYNYKSYVSKTMETFNGDDINSNKNLRILRYGEILLISAEVENELGNLAEADTVLNKIRVRAGLGKIHPVNKDLMREAIWNERRFEMAFEHDRLFDLRRTGRAGEVLRAHGKNYIDGKHDLFPIPQTQIDLSGNKLTQNPQY
jgi:hypothetical protein